MQIFAYAAELAARKRAEPGDDIATSLLHAEIDGQRLTDMEFNFFFILLLNAGVMRPATSWPGNSRLDGQSS